MTEATDRPPEPAATASRDDAPKAYSSLSLLAPGGLAVAVLYALVVVVGTVIGLFNRTAWILPPWSLAVPLATVVLCWAAQIRIQNSEGALTGARLTTWGLWLSLVVGLLYAAYYSACYLSVTRMATAVADQFFDDLKNDRLDQAFLLGQPPPRPADDAGLRARLELDFDRGPRGSGALTEFRRSQFVRQMEQGGTADRVELLGVKQWDAVTGGYQVQLSYRVSTPYVTSEVGLTVVGVDDPDGRRQWYLKIPQVLGQPDLTDEGRRMIEQGEEAQTFAKAWLSKVAEEWDWKQAYLDTLPPAERRREAKEDGARFAEGLRAFRAGELVRADPKEFWAGDKDREKIVARVKGLFGPGGDAPKAMTMTMGMPAIRRDADRTQFGFDVEIRLAPEYVVQGLLIVAADAPNGDPGPDDWWMESLELVSGKSMGESGPPRPGKPAAPQP